MKNGRRCEDSPSSKSSEGVHKGNEAESIAETLGPVDGRKTVRIRGRVHCTAAGLPGVDAPHATGDDDAWQLPEWHPLEKVLPMFVRCKAYIRVFEK